MSLLLSGQQELHAIRMTTQSHNRMSQKMIGTNVGQELMQLSFQNSLPL